ncbi:thioredoxin-like domain-containing protein [Phthorimaea operculella]|nr:thioredoxin-like domain-containing protein [Phthorimaea operculella]
MQHQPTMKSTPNLILSKSFISSIKIQHSTLDAIRDRTMEKFEEKFSDKRIPYSMKELELPELNLTAFDWLSTAKIYNKKLVPVNGKWIKDNADLIVLLFTSLGVDKDNILEKFYNIYEKSKYLNIPIEVIFFSMDETENDMLDCYDSQANWFLVRYDDVLNATLKYMYEVTCVPQLIVLSSKLEVISRNGIQDLMEYGQNAIISWLDTPSKTKQNRSFKCEAEMYGPEWRYLGQFAAKMPKYRTIIGHPRPSREVRPKLRWPRPNPEQTYHDWNRFQNIAQDPAQDIAQGSAQNIVQEQPWAPGEPWVQGEPWTQTQDVLTRLGADMESRQDLETLRQETEIRNFPQDDSRPRGMDRFEGPTNEY